MAPTWHIGSFCEWGKKNWSQELEIVKLIILLLKMVVSFRWSSLKVMKYTKRFWIRGLRLHFKSCQNCYYFLPTNFHYHYILDTKSCNHSKIISGTKGTTLSKHFFFFTVYNRHRRNRDNHFFFLWEMNLQVMGAVYFQEGMINFSCQFIFLMEFLLYSRVFNLSPNDI